MAPRQPKVINKFEGINKQDRFSIKSSYATDTKNMTDSNLPKLKVRQGYSQLGSTFGAKILGLAAWKDIELHAISNGSWYKYSGGAWSSLASGLSTTNDASFCNFKGNLSDISLIMANGTDFKYYNGTSVVNLPTAPAGGRYVEQYADRIWCAVGNDLKTTAYRKPDDWTTVTVPQDALDSWYTNVETNNGETINAIKGGLSKLTIGKPNSLHELYGYDPTDYDVREVSLTVGPINNNCLLVLNGTMYVLHPTGFYQYSGGLLPDNSFSQPIQALIDAINPSARHTCSLGTDGKRVYISIPIDSSTHPDTVIEYDPHFGIFYVWKDIQALCFATLGLNWYIGTNDSKVLQMGGSSDAGTPIASKWVSIPFGADTYSKKLRWYNIYFVADVPAGSSVRVYFSKKDVGDDDWSLIDTISPTGGTKSVRMIISTTNPAMSHFLRMKIEGTGPYEVFEITYEDEASPLT